MKNLALELSIERADGAGAEVRTESGHRFRLSSPALRNDGQDKFLLEMIDGEEIDESERPQFARAIINEIIGAPPPKQ